MEQTCHILLVENSDWDSGSLQEILRESYQLSVVRSGKAALDFLLHTLPDLIILDLNMPDMTGYETMSAIRNRQEYGDIPVVFIAGDSTREHEIKGLRMGAMDFIHRPLEPEILLSRIHNILKIEETKRKLEVSASKDSLTSLWNRQCMEENINMLGSMEEFGYGAFLLIDMDRFKYINDTYGHMMGDAILVEFGKTLIDFSRKSDFIGRIGGDEFVLFLKGITDNQFARRKAEELAKGIEENVNCFKEEKISISIGISMMPQDGRDFNSLYNKADNALYYVKQNGRNGIRFYQDSSERYIKSLHGQELSFEQILNLLEEQELEDGAFLIEFAGFKKIFQFVSRCAVREQTNAQLVCFYMKSEDDSLLEIPELQRGMKVLCRAVKHLLRKGDVATRFGNSKLLVFLPYCDSEYVTQIAERICLDFHTSNTVQNMVVSYEIKHIEPKRMGYELDAEEEMTERLG